MGFTEKLNEIKENYLTAGMPSAGTPQNVQQTAKPVSKTGSPQSRLTPNSIKKPNVNAPTNEKDPITALLMRASESEDGLDGLDELGEYLSSLGIDKTKLSGSIGELAKRLGGL